MRVRREGRLALALVAFVIAAPVAFAQVTVSFNPEADTYAYEVTPGTSYGGATSVAVGGSPYRREIFTRFAVGGLPAGAVVTDARLLVVASNRSTAAGGGGTIRRFLPATEPWSESSPTWSAPLAGSDGSGDLSTLGPVDIGGGYAFTNLAGAVLGNGRVTFVIRSVAEDGAAYYSREHGAASQRPVLRVTYAVAVNEAPVVSAGGDQAVLLPGVASLDGSVSDDGQPVPPGAVTVSWSPVSGPGGVVFADASAADTSASFPGVGTYVLRLSASDGALVASDEVAVRVTAAPVAPSIAAHPESQVVTEGRSARFGVVATGSVPLSYQWQRDGVDIGGATESSYVTPPARLADSGSGYRCVVSNVAGSITSDSAILTVDRAPVVSRYGVFEQSFTHSGSYANPYLEASATATVLGPDGRSRAVPLFWDGGATWTMRFSPDGAGRWSWQVGSADPGLDGHASVFDVLDRATGGGIRRRGASPHHFERQDGTPFWWLGDTQWRAFGSDPEEALDHSAVLHYLDVRAAQGFNYVHASLMTPGRNEGGDIFGSVPDQTLNPAYFQEVDERVRAMNDRGITAGIVLAWGSGDPSWTSFTSDAARLRYARYVAARYSAFDVAFIVSGEWDEARFPKAAFDSIGAEIRSSDPHGRLIGIHGTGSVEEFAGEAWMSFGDYHQLYTSLHGNILAARDHAKPVVNAEYAYYLRDQDGDGIVDKPNSATLEQIRHATWDLAMGGGYFVTGWGTTYLGGVRDPGLFDPDDPRNDDWEEDVQHVKTLFTGLDWWTLEPHDALLAGPGLRYCLARIGAQYVAYVRGAGGPLALSLGGAPAGIYDVRLFDPRAGAFSDLPAYAGMGPAMLTPPDDRDWVFVLTRTGEPPNQAPTVDAGPDRAVTLPGPASLDGTVSDDGLPNPPGAVATTWSRISGPGTVTFADAAAVDTTATFSGAGTYVLRLTASDGVLEAGDEMTVTVGAGAPVTVTFAPEADTYVYEVTPGTSYGSATSVAVGGSPYRREVFMRFAVSGLPAGALVTDARLLVVASNRSTAAGGGGTIRRFMPALEQWSEAVPTWNAPLAGSDGSGDLSMLGPVDVGNGYAFTSLAGAVSGNGRVTFVIRSAAEDGAAYHSREHGVVSQRPILRVTYTAAPLAPSIVAQPESQVVTEGQSAQFSVVATGSVPLSYRWRRDGVDIGGATGSSYVTPPAQLGDSGSEYRCVVSNPAGSVISDAAILTVDPAPQAVATPTITPNGGSFSGSVSVSLATTTSGASIHYTTDGSVPTAQSPPYGAPFELTASATVRARAFRSGVVESAVAAASFTVTPIQTVLRFLDRTVAAGFDLSPVDIGGWHGTYVCDYDGDGDEDLFMTSHGIGQAPDTGRNALFRNDGAGRFTERAQIAGVDGGLHGRFTRELHGASWLDCDHDGDFDLFMPNTDSNAQDANWRAGDELYRNNGNGTFTNVSAASGFPQLDYSRRGAAAGDFDRDGQIDLFVVDMIRIEGASETHVVPSPYRAVYRHLAGGTFCLEGGSGCPQRSGVEHVGWSEGVTTLDYDGDGDVDVLVADEQGGPDPGHGLLLWENDGTGRFIEVAGSRGLPSTGVNLNGAVTAGDVDNDGDLDVFTVVVTTSGGATTFSGRLYRNDGGSFTHARTFADRGADSEHMFLADLDNDGDLDLVWAGAYLNNGDGTFGPNRASEFAVSPSGRGGMAFDADGDGDLDVVFNVSDRTYPYLRYYRNDVQSAGRFLKVKLVGPGGQAGAPGAKLYVYDHGHLGEAGFLLGYREVATATGFVSGPSPVQHFGLGARDAVDVRVVFPLGQVEERLSVPADTTVSISAP